MRILAFDIGGTAIKIGLINENGQILESREVPTLAKEGGEALMNKVISLVHQYKGIDRIGVSTAGQVDNIKGKIIFASDNIPGWTGTQIKRRIQEASSIPTVVENDVNAAALGEAFYGAAVDTESFLCLAYGTGIGGAIVEKGEIYRGASGSAGEFGHIITHVGGKNCTCGGRGCYETYASTTALVNMAQKELNIGNIDGKIIFKLLEEGNENIKEIIHQWLFEINVGLVNLVHIFNPSLIVLGGGIMCQPYVINYLKENINKYIMPNYKNVVITGAKLGNNAGILGAAHLAMNLK